VRLGDDAVDVLLGDAMPALSRLDTDVAPA
jgi:hypothetical protein